MTDWQPIETAPHDKIVRTKIIDADGERNCQLLTLHCGLWWFPDCSMYVYYTPTHWAPT